MLMALIEIQNQKVARTSVIGFMGGSLGDHVRASPVPNYDLSDLGHNSGIRKPKCLG
jgi:hypothetical protein